MYKKILLISVPILVIFIVLKVSSLFETKQDKIRKIIYSAKAATERENLLKGISYISFNYHDKDGLDRSSLFMIGKKVFESYDDISIMIEDLRVDVVDDYQAKAHILAFGQGKRLSSEKFKYILDRDRVKFDVVFRKEDDDWKVVELKFIEPEDFLWQLKDF